MLWQLPQRFRRIGLTSRSKLTTSAGLPSCAYTVEANRIVNVTAATVLKRKCIVCRSDRGLGRSIIHQR